MSPRVRSPMLVCGSSGHGARAERERRIDMGNVVLEWWCRAVAGRTIGAVEDTPERGATFVECLMVVALCLAAAVLVASLGTALTGGDVV